MEKNNISTFLADARQRLAERTPEMQPARSALLWKELGHQYFNAGLVSAAASCYSRANYYSKVAEKEGEK